VFKPEMSYWQGRDDTGAEGDHALRWHQRVLPWDEGAAPGTALIGFVCDEGIRRNHGRVGAANGPIVLRRALSQFAWHQSAPVYDCGDVICQYGDLETAQKTLSHRLSHLLQVQQMPIVMGGGHETAWGTFRGLSQLLSNHSIGIINLDTHFDIRQSKQAHSGTAFAQIADWCKEQQKTFYYLCLGVCEAANTRALFERAAEFQVQWVNDVELPPWRLDSVISKLHEFIKQVDALYLSVDLDVLPGSVMPAVSAPARLGVPLESIERLILEVAHSRKLAVADVVEFNPNLDHDSQGARVAAGVVWHLARHWHKTPLVKRAK
jgi:formiminoglutamase